tara:strand:+ start:292 stop:591 length:300 start_codon:yes stop_codon:yes gene_type:complete
MSKPEALKFLLLQKLAKHKEKIKDNNHSEIAHSLSIIIKDGKYSISWKSNNIEKNYKVDEVDFIFYTRSDTPNNPTNITQINTNEQRGSDLAIKIIELS